MEKRNIFSPYRSATTGDSHTAKSADRRIFTQRVRKFLGRTSKK
ncbi:hypothetical protein [Brevibacillus humidisoli]|nr:hypothetical protein [Brevibacillus humidisoli]